MTKIKFVGALLLCLAGTAQAAEAVKYGILSLSGGTITVVNRVQEIGARVHGGKHVVQNPNLEFDETAIRAVSEELQAPHHLMLTQDRELYAAQHAMFEQPEAQAANRAFMASLWKDKGVSHVVLVSSLRTSLDVKLRNDIENRGKVEGLGFYIDNEVELYDHTAQTASTGLLMPFAYLKFRLLDANTLAVLAETDVKASGTSTHRIDGDASLRAWKTLTNEQKVGYLNALVQRAAADGVPKILRQAGLR